MGEYNFNADLAAGNLYSNSYLVRPVSALNEQHTITTGDITNGYILLTHLALDSSLQLSASGGIVFTPNVDYVVGTMSGVTKITWTGYALAPLLAANDVLLAYYTYETGE